MPRSTPDAALVAAVTEAVLVALTATLGKPAAPAPKAARTASRKARRPRTTASQIVALETADRGTWVSKPCDRLLILRGQALPLDTKLSSETIAFYTWAKGKGARSVKAARKLWAAYRAGAR